MIRTLAAHLRAPVLAAALCSTACQITPDYSRPLPPGAPALIPLRDDEAKPDVSLQWERRDEILPALERSLTWMARPHTQRYFPIEGVTHERARASLEALGEALRDSHGPSDFQERIEREFTFYKSAGWNGRGGGVLFTGYCTPILRGSLTADATYKYPLYALPPDLLKGPEGEILGWDTAVGVVAAYPSRASIERHGLLADKDLELVWLEDPIDAYLAHVNGSAFIELPDGSLFRVGYAGKNGRPYTSLGRELEAEGRIPRGEASLATIRAWAAEAGMDELNDYLFRNESYVFFTPIENNPHGSLDFPVTTERSIATDKTLFPRGAAVFVEAELSTGRSAQRFHELMFDQDTGGAIRTAGRADLYLGIGPEAEARAGSTKAEGQMYYLFLREELPRP